MPILNTRVTTHEKNQDGEPIPSHAGLQLTGPRVHIAISPLEGQLKSSADKGETPTTPVVGWALIDTGASLTCIDQKTAEKAGLALVDSGPITSATHDNEVVPIFAGRLKIEGLPQYLNAHRAYGVNLEPQGLVALLGRDMLTNCVFIYNGPDGSFSLSI